MPQNAGTKPLVSICLPVYNEEEFIGETIESILNQTYKNNEILIFDNASTDRTPEICEKFKDDVRLRVFRNAVNIGHINNFNRCFSVASGDFVNLRSANDTINPDFIERLVALLMDDPDTGLAYAKSKVVGKDPNDVRKVAETEYFSTDSGDIVKSAGTVIEKFSFASPVFGLFRRSLIEGLQPFRFCYGSDAILVCEASLYASIRHTDDELFVRRLNADLEQLVNIHSEDWVYGQSRRSLFSKLEYLTPVIDLLWGYLEMFGRARVEEKKKAVLGHNARVILQRRFDNAMKKEKAKILDFHRENEKIFQSDHRGIHYLVARANLLDRLKKAMVAFPEDEDLRRLAIDMARTM